MNSSPLRARLLGIILFITITVLDQWSKSAVVAEAQTAGLPQNLLPFFNFVLVRNHGISFGFFAQGQNWMALFITVVTSGVALGLFFWLLRATQYLVAFALGFIIGGALGNIIDRVRLGSVIDFLDFHVGLYHWPAFNIADSAIFIGVVILVLISIVGPVEKKENTK